MSESLTHLNYIIMYHIYGLAFFSMGLAMALEVGRSPLLAEARILRPLAVFGILHGIHEWMELYTVQSSWHDIALPKSITLFRLLVLAFSFVSLTAYGIQALRPKHRLHSLDVYVGSGLLLLYGLVILINHVLPWKSDPDCFRCADALARYLLAIPGGMLAAVALRYQANEKFGQTNDKRLANCLILSSWGFGLYALAQIFVNPADVFPAPFLNKNHFEEFTGIPIQLVRSLLAIFITYNLIRATQILDKKRQRQLLTAQQDRLDALEAAQREALKRRDLRRHLLRHVVLAQEEERARISRELHDETAQILTASSLNMATLKNFVIENPQAREIIERTQDLCQDMSQALHRLVHDLRPAQLDDLGLVPALQHLIDESGRGNNLKITLTVSGKEKRLDPLIETVLYRVTQEGLTNIARHAGTNTAAIELHFDAKQVSLQIHDTGRGFDPDSLPAGSGMGLAGMQERVAAVAGQFQVDSTPGVGTLLDIVIPCELSGRSKQTGTKA